MLGTNSLLASNRYCAIQLLGPAAELDSSSCCGVGDTNVLDSSERHQITPYTLEGFVLGTNHFATMRLHFGAFLATNKTFKSHLILFPFGRILSREFLIWCTYSQKPLEFSS